MGWLFRFEKLCGNLAHKYDSQAKGNYGLPMTVVFEQVTKEVTNIFLHAIK